MIKFLIKGLLRDRHRSLFPIITVTLGSMLSVLMTCWITGVFDDMINYNAKYVTGHVRIMTQAYAEEQEQVPNDLAIRNANQYIEKLKEEYPRMEWVKRIKFGGLLDIPDENGETKEQGPTTGLAVDLLSDNNKEVERLNIKESIVKGRLPQKSGEILISDQFAEKLKVEIGDPATIISSTMYQSMAIANFEIVGTIKFGVRVMDKGSVILDINDAQFFLDMVGACGEIFGYFPGSKYNDEEAQKIAAKFNKTFTNPDDEFSPKMVRLKEYHGLKEYLAYGDAMAGIIIFIFISVMTLVLWNAGLLGGIRRYGEIGVRLAIGETKTHIYRSMIYESVVIGTIGSIIGSAIGLSISYLLSKGIDMSAFMQESTMMIPTEMRTKITAQSYYMGIIPGVGGTVLGTILSGIGIFKRKTAQLFKELE